jgi:anti-sigma regulatory factor (Ser/Thr protein kinase)
LATPRVASSSSVGLPVDVVAAARESHPHVVRDGKRRASSSYQGVDGIDGADRRPLTPPPESHRLRAFGPADVMAVRREVREWAAAQGVGASRAADLALAVHEAAVNSIRHGGGRGVLRSWREDGAAVCEIADAGELRDPLAGRSLPVSESPSGRGLWLINHLCDLVQIRATASGAVVRMRQLIGRAP